MNTIFYYDQSIGMRTFRFMKRRLILICLILLSTIVSTTFNAHAQSIYYSIQMNHQINAPLQLMDHSPLCYSFLFDWAYLRKSYRIPEGPRGNPYILNDSKSAHKSMVYFLRACRIPFIANPPVSKTNSPITTRKAREYFLSRLRRLWRPSGLLLTNYFNELSAQWPMFSQTSQRELYKLVNDFERFPSLFPKDRYLGAYASLCSVIARSFQPGFSAKTSRRFKVIEQKYSDFPEVGLSSAWWHSLYLASNKRNGAKSAFRHTAQKYSRYDWWLVAKAKEAMTGGYSKWISLGLILRVQ